VRAVIRRRADVEGVIPVELFSPLREEGRRRLVVNRFIQNGEAVGIHPPDSRQVAHVQAALAREVPDGAYPALREGGARENDRPGVPGSHEGEVKAGFGDPRPFGRFDHRPEQLDGVAGWGLEPARDREHTLRAELAKIELDRLRRVQVALGQGVHARRGRAERVEKRELDQVQRAIRPSLQEPAALGQDQRDVVSLVQPAGVLA
jgi:hypothetical protein